MLYPKDPQDAVPVAYDHNGTEIWHNDHTVIYEDIELVWEHFRDEMLCLLKREAGVLLLAEEMGLTVTRYD